MNDTAKKIYADSLISLLEHTDISAISVQQIVQVANKSRSSFYRSFEGKEECLLYAITKSIESWIYELVCVELIDATYDFENSSLRGFKKALRNSGAILETYAFRMRLTENLTSIMALCFCEKYSIVYLANQGQIVALCRLASCAILACLDSWIADNTQVLSGQTHIAAGFFVAILDKRIMQFTN